MDKLICFMDDQLISKYLDDTLTAIEKKEFDARMSSDPTFRKEVDAMQAVHRMLSQFSVQPAPHGLESRILAQISPRVNRMINGIRWILGVWALFTVVLLVLRFTGWVNFSDTLMGLDSDQLTGQINQYQTWFSVAISMSATLFFLYFSQSWIKKLARRPGKRT